MAKKFKVPRKARTIELDGDLEGGVVEIGDAPMSFMLKLSSREEMKTADEEEAMVRQFGDQVLISWNLVDEDEQDIPANGEGAISLPSSIFNAVFLAWLSSLGGDENLEKQQPEANTSV